MSDNIDSISIQKTYKLLWAIIILIFIMAGCGVWAFYSIKKSGHTAVASAPAQAPAQVYLPLDTFTVNLINPDNDPERVLYIGLTLQLPDQATYGELTTYLPEARSRLLLLFARQSVASLSTEEGKQRLLSEIKTVLSKPYLQGRASQVISDVLFTQFILR